MKRLARLTLLAYPRAFRRTFGADYLQTVADLRTHGRHRNARVMSRLLTDALITAPTMRWENLMNSTKTILVVVAAIVAVPTIIVAPFVAVPLVLIVAALAISAQRHDQPFATEADRWARRWYLWLAAAAFLFLVGVTMLITADNGELSAAAWATWIVSWVAATVIATVGIGLGATRHLNRRRSQHAATGH